MGGFELLAVLDQGGVISGDAAQQGFDGVTQSAFDEHRATLEIIGSTQYLGADPAAAAVQDLTLFGLWYDAQIGYLRALVRQRIELGRGHEGLNSILE